MGNCLGHGKTPESPPRADEPLEPRDDASTLTNAPYRQTSPAVYHSLLSPRATTQASPETSFKHLEMEVTDECNFSRQGIQMPGASAEVPQSTTVTAKVAPHIPRDETQKRHSASTSTNDEPCRALPVLALPFDTELTASATEPEHQSRNSDEHLTHVYREVERVASNQHAANIAIKQELERIRGEAALTRGEVEAIGLQAEEKARLDKQRANIERLPAVPGASYDEWLGCMAHTRIAVIEEIVNFLTREDIGETRIFLLSGCAGSGKTAIAHSIASICEHKYHILGASFFFHAGQNLRDRPDQFVTTLARGLSAHNFLYASQLSDAIETHPMVALASLANQLQTLLLGPLSDIPSPSQCIAIVIDAVDEGWSEQLFHIIKSCSTLPSWIRVFMTLRDDGSILPRLRSQNHICRREINNSTESNVEDIRLYVGERLRTIAIDRRLHDWPTEDAISRMCSKAEGLFVWATVACNSIADIDLDPLEQFEELMRGGPGRDTRASSQLDELYRKVLSKCRFDEPRTLFRYRQCLGAILVLKQPLTIEGLNRLIDEYHTKHTLRPFTPVLYGLADPDIPQPIRIIHQSFREFVTQAIPSEKYYIVENEQNEYLALCCLRSIGNELPLLAKYTAWIADEERDPYSSVPSMPEGVISEALRYACKYVAEHVQTATGTLPGLQDALARFMRQDVHGWLSICAMTGKCQGIEQLQECTQRFGLVGDLGVNPAPLALTTMKLARSLAFDNRLEEGLLVARASVSLCRIVGLKTEKDSESMAAALNTLAKRLAALNEREEALATARESANIYRTLAADRPAAFNSDFSNSLHNLAVDLSKLGYRDEALAVIQEAVSIRRDLASNSPAKFNSHLAWSLDGLSCCLTDLGRHKEALEAASESVDLRRNLAKSQPAAFNADLADSLSNISVDLIRMGHQSDALATAREAVSIRRELAREQPLSFNPDLVLSLSNLSVFLTGLGQLEEALSVINEAIPICRDLAKERPAVHNRQLARSLSSFSFCLSQLGRFEEALAAIREAVVIFRGLVENHPAAFNPDLVHSLSQLSHCLYELDNREDALVVTRERLAICRDLVILQPTRFNSDLAQSLYCLAKQLCGEDTKVEAVDALRESEKIYRALAEGLPLVYQTRLEKASQLLQELESKRNA